MQNRGVIRLLLAVPGHLAGVSAPTPAAASACLNASEAVA